MGADGLAKDNGFLPASTDEVLKRSKQLELNEDFRRAARNSMIWSLLALIAGIGRASGAEVNVTFLGAGLTFGQSTLAAGALIGAGFMFLAYFRAYQRFRNQNNELAFDVAAGEMIKAVKALNVIAEEARAEVVSAAKSAEQLQLETVQYMNEFKRRGQSLVKPPRIGDVLRQIKAATPMYSLEYGPSGYPHPRSVRQTFMEVIDKEYKASEAADKEYLTEVDTMSGGVIPGLQIVHDGILSVQDAHIQRYDAATRSLRETANRLDRFHRTISQRELFWHFGMDVLAVIALFLVGVGFSGALIAGYPATEEFPWLNTAQIKPVLAEGQ